MGATTWAAARIWRGLLLLVAILCVPVASTWGQASRLDAADLVDRPISEVRITGLARVPEQKVRNNIRAAVGDPFDAATISGDVALLQGLGEFKYVEAEALIAADGSVVLTYKLQEQAIIAEVQTVGNKLISDQELLAVVQQTRMGPRDDFLIENAKRNIETLYRRRGHYLTTVVVDDAQLERTGILILRVIEGPRVKVRSIVFQGNESIERDRLHAQISTRTAMFLFRKGELDEEKLIDDVAALDKYYKDRGYLDVRVDRTIELSPDNREAKITFVIAEGPVYTLRRVASINVVSGEATELFSPQMLGALIEIKPGDVFSEDLLRKSLQAIEDSYGHLGYLDTRIEARYLRVPDESKVDLVLEVQEGTRAHVGEIIIRGNFLTQSRVIGREVRLRPGQPFDGTEIEKSEKRLEDTRLFNEARITILEADPNNPLYRDVLVEVKERNTGSVNFGVAVGSDSGLFGEFSINQTNFDITDTPESFKELITGRAFRGGGQTFNSTLRPGTELFQYTISLTEPHLFDSEYSGRISGNFRQREYDQFEETRLGGNLRIGRRLGDVWQVASEVRGERIALDDIDDDAPTEFFRDEGPDLLTGLSMSLVRTTTGTFIRPSRGSRLELSFERVGLLGGDIDFNNAQAEYTVFFTLNEDFLGRKSILKLNSRIGYIFDGRAPVYERYYMGGRTLRGFEFRTVSPKGIRADNGLPSDESVGGNWQLFVGAQYEIPIFQELLNGVVFIDSGTVTDDPGIDDYRVSVGIGIRLYIPQFGSAPIAFDFAFPIVKEETDEEQLFSFSADIPF